LTSSLEVIEKTNVNVLAPIFGTDNSDFSAAVCYRYMLSAVWQSLLISVCEAWHKIECRIYGGWVKMQAQF